ncbi:hypothetical protein [Amycolatopsis palatopharyngis]|uniref:hypothetical protein n=1 Tax=Amycolatopsis palatopharyngis TaxID=187982 RepID=UPI0013BEA801|nr:hypothetical protein [Amycolatopsis palatopharyngis]
MLHTEPHQLAGQDVTVTTRTGITMTFRIEDWWDRITGGSWMNADGNPAAMAYAVRSVECGLPVDNAVVYGKSGGFGHLVHVSEIVVDDPGDTTRILPAAGELTDGQLLEQSPDAWLAVDALSSCTTVDCAEAPVWQLRHVPGAAFCTPHAATSLDADRRHAPQGGAR